MDVDAAATKPQTQPESDSDEGAKVRLESCEHSLKQTRGTHNAPLQTCQASGLYINAGCLFTTDK